MKKIALSLGTIAFTTLPLAMVISCGAGGGINNNYTKQLGLYDPQMVSTKNMTQLNNDTEVTSKKINQLVNIEKIGLDYVDLPEGMTAEAKVVKPWDETKNEITVGIRLTKSNKSSIWKNVTIFPVDSDNGVVLNLAKEINDLSLITNESIIPTSEKKEFNASIWNGFIGTNGKVLVGSSFINGSGLPSDLKGAKLTYETKGVQSTAKNPVVLGTLAIIITKNDSVNLAAIAVTSQIEAQNTSDVSTVSDLKAALDKLKVTSKIAISAVTTPTPFTIGILKSYGEITAGTPPNNFEKAILTYKISKDIALNASGEMKVQIYKGLALMQEATIEITVSKETT